MRKSGISIKQVARIMDISEITVKKEIQGGRKMNHELRPPGPLYHPNSNSPSSLKSFKIDFLMQPFSMDFM